MACFGGGGPSRRGGSRLRFSPWSGFDFGLGFDTALEDDSVGLEDWRLACSFFQFEDRAVPSISLVWGYLSLGGSRRVRIPVETGIFLTAGYFYGGVVGRVCRYGPLRWVIHFLSSLPLGVNSSVHRASCRYVVDFLVRRALGISSGVPDYTSILLVLIGNLVYYSDSGRIKPRGLESRVRQQAKNSGSLSLASLGY